jgi:uncharacterized damage-inducible protein DinB
VSHYTPALFGELYKHMEWADATLWRSALSNAGATSDEMLRNYLHHMHLTQQLFLAFWTGTPAEPIAKRQPSEFSLPDLCEWAQPFYGQARAFLESATPDVLARPLVMPWVAQYEKQLGRTFDVATVGETAFQVVSHSTHHRAQANARLRAVGGDPPIVDYIAWIWFGRPGAPWD